MATRNDGGQAFPRPASEFTEHGTCPDGNLSVPAEEGMTLRDYFAGQVLANVAIRSNDDKAFTPAPAFIAEVAYAVADAMIAERDK